MMFQRTSTFGLILGGLVVGLGMTAVQGCKEGGVGDQLLEQCGLKCDEQAFLDGKFAVSGIANVDAFFSATLDFSSAVATVAADIEAEIAGLYALVGAEVGGDFKAALETKLSGYIDIKAGLKVKAEPARCEASLDITAKAAAECDVEATPGSVEVTCEGTCDIEASAQADCHAAGGLTCRGTPPDLSCSGTCYGGCDLTAAAACDGDCRGSCTIGNKTQENFEGRCNGMCEGSCVVEAGASCGGKCTGTCEFTPPSGSCDAAFEARCSASAEAKVECKGGCDGKATPPMVSAECEAAVEAKAEASVQCYPPSLTFEYTFAGKAEANADLQAEFRAFLNTFKVRYGALLAALAKAEGLVDVGGKLGGAGVAAVEALAGELEGEASLKASVGGACAIAVLPSAAELITDASAKLAAQVQASASVTAAVAGG